MSKLTEGFRDIGTYNDHGFFDRGRVFVSYGPGDKWFSPRWQVVRPGFKTDPDAHWKDNGHKTFYVWRRDEKAAQLEAAKAWAGEKYGITEWARSPFGGWGDAAFVKARTAELKAEMVAENTQQESRDA